MRMWKLITALVEFAKTISAMLIFGNISMKF